MGDGAAGTVDMSEFLLNETQAQLQLALFGEDEAFMARTNAPFRRAMAGKGDPRTGARDFLMEVVDRTPIGSVYIHAPNVMRGVMFRL